MSNGDLEIPAEIEHLSRNDIVDKRFVYGVLEHIRASLTKATTVAYLMFFGTVISDIFVWG